MRFTAQTALAHGVFGPDPIASPASVTDAMLLHLSGRKPSSSTQPLSIVLSLDAGAGETATVDVFAVDDDLLDKFGVGSASMKFYKIQGGLVVTNGVLAVVTIAAATPPPAGTLYARMTADTMAGAGVLRAGLV